jgi:hypothetical protein
MCLHKPFDELWKDIQVVLSNKNSVETLVQKVSNNIIGIERDHIKVKSEKPEKLERFHVHSSSMSGIYWLPMDIMFQEIINPIFIVK